MSDDDRHGDTPHFLRALGLGRDADERAIRRAYARQLKRIDQETDPHGFQALRETYETALRWNQLQARRLREQRGEETGEASARLSDDGGEGGVAAPAPMSSVPPARHRDAQPAQAQAHDAPDQHGEALAQGDAVFAEFQARLAPAFLDEAGARDALHDALCDERLVNLEARAFFEWRVARLLMDGWRPGHEFLFGPACDAFNWDSDRRRLALFGPVGAAMDAAVQEKLMFFQQPRGDFERKRKLIQGLRHSRVPDTQALIEEMPQLLLLMQHYPHWMQAVTSADHFTQRRQAFEALTPAERAVFRQPQPEAARGQAPGAPQAKSYHLWWFVLMLLLALGRFMSYMGSSASTQAAAAATPSSSAWTAPSYGEPPLPPLIPPATPATLSTWPPVPAAPNASPVFPTAARTAPPPPDPAGESAAEQQRRLKREAERLVQQTRQMLADHQARFKAAPAAPPAAEKTPPSGRAGPSTEAPASPP